MELKYELELRWHRPRLGDGRFLVALFLALCHCRQIAYTRWAHVQYSLLDSLANEHVFSVDNSIILQTNRMPVRGVPSHSVYERESCPVTRRINIYL